MMSQTSYSDDFSGELDETIWISQQGHNHSIEDGQLKISVNKKEETEKFRISFEDSPLNIDDNPVMNFRIRANKAIKLRFDFNLAGVVYTQRISVPKSDLMVPYSVDLMGAGLDYDLTNLKFIDVYVNENAVSYSGALYVDDFVLGDGAVMHANIGGIDPPVIYAGEESVKLLFKDITNASGISVSGAGSYIENVSASPVFESAFSNTAYVMFDVQDGVEGDGTLSVTATGAGDYADNTLDIPLSVVTNMAPGIDQPEDIELEVGTTTPVHLTGLTDGDAGMDQALSLTATSSDQAVISDGDILIDYKKGSPYATLHLEATAEGSADITVEVDDGGDSNNTASVVFTADAWVNLNLPPVIDRVPDQVPTVDGTEKTIPLTGIGDGNGGTQTLTLSAVSMNQNIVDDASISITGYNAAEGTAMLHYTPDSAGTDTLVVTVADDAAGTDNGVKETTMEIILKPVQAYATGHGWSLFNDPDRWNGDSGIEVEKVKFDGDSVLKVTGTDKWIWGALNIGFSDTSLNLTDYPYVTLDIYSVDNRTLHWLWFYDDYELTHDGAHRNDFPDVTHDEGKAVWVEPDQWTTINFDFSGENEMSRNAGDEAVPINAKRIVRILYNYHDKESSWPRPPEYTGTFYIRNFRVGDKADVPDPLTTIDPVPDQVLYENPGAQSVTVTGLSDGAGGLPDVSIESLNSGFVDPSIGAVQGDGTAEISYDPGAATGEAEIVLTVSATNSTTVTDTFLIKTVTKNEQSASGITIDMSERHQVIHGFGTFSNEYFDLYTGEMGASAIRYGIIGNRTEPVNDNTDPYVLNREALNYDAFNWDAVRRMKEQGVETFILTSWSAPAWMKDNHSESWFGGAVVPWEEAPNRTSPFYYDEWAEFFVGAYRMFEEEAGVKLDGIGIQNEPAFYEPYPSAILSPEEFAKIVAIVGKRFEEEGIETKLYMPEQVFSQPNYSMSEYISAVNANPEADKYCGVIATHGYASDGIGAGQPNFSSWTNMYNQSQEGEYPKELWMTETHKAYNSYDDAMWIAMAIYGGLEYGNMGLWTQWGIVGQHIVDGNPTQMLYTVANYARFIKPGAVRVTSTSEHDNLFATSYVDEERGRLSTVVINNSDAAISTKVSGSGVPSGFEVYQTTALRKCEHMGTISDGLFVAPPNSVTTLVSTGNRAPEIDPVEDQVVAFNAGQQAVTLTGIDPADDGQSVSNVEATTDNATLITNLSVGTLQPDGSAALNYQPAAGESGQATITVTVTDDGPDFVSNTATMQFDVMVYDQYNNEPIVERVNDQFVVEDADGTLTVDIPATDGDDGSQTLTGAVSVDNTELIPSISYNNNTQQVEYTVAPEKFGEATVKVTITDDGGSDHNNGDQSDVAEFKIMVASVNDAPVVTPLDDIQVGMNAAEQALTIEGIGMGDPFGEDQELTVWAETDDLSLITSPMVEYFQGNSTAELMFTPIRNEMGTASITVYVMDDGTTLNGGVDLTSFTFNVEVIAANINHAPSMDPIDDMTMLLEDGAETIDLEGVDDGDEDKDQTITITAESSDESVIEPPVVNWVPSMNVGSIKLTPADTGTTTITVTVTDNGGTAYGGVDSQQYAFVVTVDTQVGIGDESNRMFGLYPNPAREQVFVTMPAFAGDAVMTLIDPVGKVYEMQQVSAGTAEHTLDLTGLDAGLYILRLQAGEKVYRTTLIKN